MAISEQLPHQLYSRLEQVLGREEAAALIEYFPPQGWNDVVRKADLDAIASELRSEMRVLSAELRGEISDLRAELHEQIGGVRGEIGSVRGEIGSVRAEIGSLRAEMRTQTRSLFLSLVGLQITGAGMAVALSRTL